MKVQSEMPEAIAVLIREHDACRAQLAAAEQALTSARPSTPASSARALTIAGELLRYLETSLETHIAKEEEPLFPRLKAALPLGDRLIDEMIAEHDLIRMKRDDVEAVLQELLGGHDDLRAERQALRLAMADVRRPVASLGPLVAAVATVSAKLHVHFENEEELVFPLAPDLLSAEELVTVLEEMTAIEVTATEA